MTTKNVRWFFNVSKWEPNMSEMLLATRCVQPEEKDRLARFVFKRDVKSSLIGRLMMRKFVSEATGKPYDQIIFGRDSKGKPFINSGDDFPSIDFNISHQGDFTVLAGQVGNVKLGVDVMKLEYTGGKSLSEFFRIMNRNFAIEEWKEIKSPNSESKQIAMFCRHWCLKESYVKALGVGITINLQDIVFSVHTKDLEKDNLVCDTELFVKTQKEEWEFHEMLIGNSHCVVVALSGNNNERLYFTELSFENLMQNAIPLLQEDDYYCKQYFSKLDKP